MFPNDESNAGDVVKVDVESEDLRRLNQKIANALPNTETHPGYKPHATIAYVKAGLGKKYAGKPVPGVSGQEITLDRIVFSDPSGRQTEIPLRGGLAPPGEPSREQPEPAERPARGIATPEAPSPVGVESQASGTTPPIQKPEAGVAPAEEAESEPGEPNYALGAAERQEPSITIEAVSRAFPKTEIRQHDGGFVVELPAGQLIWITPNAEIYVNPERFREAYGYPLPPGNVIAGEWQVINHGGIIRLAKLADEGTLHHEAFHAAMQLTLSPEEKAEILEKYGSEESAAYAYERWREGNPPNTWFGKIRAYFRNLYARLFDAPEAVFGRIRRGEVWGGEAKPLAAGPRYATQEGPFRPHKEVATAQASKEPEQLTGEKRLDKIQEFFNAPVRSLAKLRNPPKALGRALSENSLKKALKYMLPAETRIGMAGAGTGERLQKLNQTARRWGKVSAGKRLVRLTDGGLHQLKHEQRFNLLDVLEGRADPIDHQVRQAYLVARDLLDDIADEAQGLEIMVRSSDGSLKRFETIEDYYPHFLRGPAALKSGKVRNDVIENLVRQDIRDNRAQAEQFLDQYIEFLESGQRQQSLLDYLVRTNQADNHAEAWQKLQRSTKHVKRHGSLEFSREVNLPFYDPDPLRVLPQHIMAASIRMAEATAFGQEGEVITTEVEGIREAAGKFETREEEAAYVDKAIQRIINNVNAADRPAERKARAFMAVQAFKLGLAALPNSTQGVLNGYLRTDLPSVAVGFAALFSRRARRFGIEAGAMVDPLLHETMQDVSESSRAQHILDTAVRKYLEAVQFTSTERNNRILAANAGAYYAERMMRRLRRNPGDKFARDELQDMSIDAEAALKRGGLDPDDVLMAANTISEQTQFSSDPALLPLWASHPAGRVFFQYKNFAYNQTVLVSRMTFGEFYKGHFGRGLRNFLILGALFPIAGEIIKDIRNFFTGRKRKEKLVSLDRYFDNVAQAGSTGIFADVAESAQYGRLEGVPLGPTGSDVLEGGYMVFGRSGWGNKTSRLKALQRIGEQRSPLIRAGKHWSKEAREAWHASRRK